MRVLEGLLREDCLHGKCRVKVRLVCLSSLTGGRDLERLGIVTIVDPGC